MKTISWRQEFINDSSSKMEICRLCEKSFKLKDFLFHIFFCLESNIFIKEISVNSAKLNHIYKMARIGYIIDNQKPDSTQNIANQFIHTQFFALVDRYRRVRGIYDGLKEDEVQKLIIDIKGLLKEKITTPRFMNGFSNNPN